jgi:alpha-beta hydrolase superfamily lysophospholipase
MYCNSNNGGLLAEAISKKCNINVYGLDFLNAGKSQSDEPGYYKSMDYLIQQAHSFMEVVLNRFKTRPQVFISGMSMGGAICFELSVRYPKDIAGVIFLGPAFR